MTTCSNESDRQRPPPITYGCVCSGLSAPTLAVKELGWKTAFFSEIEAFPRAVLAHHYPDIPCHGDFTTIGADDYGPIDLLVGGTPCQSFSVAGKRMGLDDHRGNLTLEFIKLAERKKPTYVVWENVPGVLSDEKGQTIQTVIDLFTQIGYVCDIDILDAQYFGLAQRRRRVFVVCVRLDVLLRRKTTISERIMADLLAQALRATWDAIRPVSFPAKLPSESERLTEELRNSARLRMLTLKNLLGEYPVTRLLEFWDDRHLQSTDEPLPSESFTSQRAEQPIDISKMGIGGCHATTHQKRSKRAVANESGDQSTVLSWRRSLEDLWTLLNQSTTSTAKGQITDQTICSFAKAALNIVQFTINSPESSLQDGWSEDYWSVAHSLSTLIEGFTNYARSTTFDLFSPPQLHNDWGANLDQAGNLQDILERRCRDWAGSFSVLLEPEGLCGNPPPSREKRTAVAALTATDVGTCGADDNQGQAGHLIAQAFGGNNTSGPIEVATACNAHGGPSGRLDFESETFIAHTLRGEGFDASEDGTGRGTPLVPVAFAQNSRDELRLQNGDGSIAGALSAQPGMKQTTYLAFPANMSATQRGVSIDRSASLRTAGEMAICYPLLEPGARTGISTSDPRAGIGIGSTTDPMFTLQAGKQHGVAVSLRGRDGGATAEVSGDVMPALRASQGGGDKPHVLSYGIRTANTSSNGWGIQEECSHTLDTTGPQKISTGSTVRRLLPEECEKLQGVPKGFTSIAWRGKPADHCPDGPRYKIIGNSMAVPCMKWILERLDFVNAALYKNV